MTTAHIATAIRHLRRTVLQQDRAGWTDGQLLESFINQKDEAAFAALVRIHSAMVFGVCRRIIRNHHDAEDAFQATFVVLARKAASIRPRERLANWLHGVALRVAMKAKAMTAKRRGRENQVREVPDSEAAPDNRWLDVPPLLDQELNGLPKNYRLPILLCDLEGKTIKEATQQLGWPQGTLAGRLARGRKLLAKRLANRGVVLSAGSLATVVARSAATPAVPTSLLSSTVKAAAMIAARQATLAGAVPARVAILTEGVLKAMLLRKLKTATAGLLLLAFLIGAAAAIRPMQAAGPQNDEPGKKSATSSFPEPASPKAAEGDEFQLRSRLMEAGTDQPKELLVLPRATVFEGQVAAIHCAEPPQNLLDKVVIDENIKIGIFLDVRMKHLGGNKARLRLSFARNELETSTVSEMRVIGNSFQAIQDVELHKPVNFVFQKDARGSPLRWVEIIVDEQVAERRAPPSPVAGP